MLEKTKIYCWSPWAASLLSGRAHKCPAYDIRMFFSIFAETIPIMCWLKIARVLKHDKDLLPRSLITCKACVIWTFEKGFVFFQPNLRFAVWRIYICLICPLWCFLVLLVDQQFLNAPDSIVIWCFWIWDLDVMSIYSLLILHCSTFLNRLRGSMIIVVRCISRGTNHFKACVTASVFILMLDQVVILSSRHDLEYFAFGMCCEIPAASAWIPPIMVVSTYSHIAYPKSRP